MVKYNVGYIEVILKLKIKLRFFAFGLILLSTLCLYVAVACYHTITIYNAKLVSLEKLLKESNDRNAGFQEEDLFILRQIDEVNKKIKEQDDKIRIQDSLINEVRAKKRNK
jgi:hypothetical protein